MLGTPWAEFSWRQIRLACWEISHWRTSLLYQSGFKNLENVIFHICWSSKFNLEQLSLSNISKNNFYTAKVYYGVKVCRRNTLVGHPPSVSVPCVPSVASPGELNTDYWHRMLGLSWSEDPGLCSRPRPAHLQPKPLVQSLSLDLSTLNVNSILKFIKHFHQESFKW